VDDLAETLGRKVAADFLGTWVLVLTMVSWILDIP
jgi:hypothetical protein